MHQPPGEQAPARCRGVGTRRANPTRGALAVHQRTPFAPVVRLPSILYTNRVTTRGAIRLAIVFAAYLATARLGLALGAASGFAALVWAPTGISMAAMLVWGFAIWPAVAGAALIVNHLAGAPLPVAALIAAGNTAEALAGASMLRAAGFDARLQRLTDVLAMVGLGALASAVISAAVGVGALRAGGIVTAAQLGRTFRIWWVGDVMGVLVVTPALLITATRPRLRTHAHTALEVAAATVVVAATVAIVFWTRRPASALWVPAYVLFPVLLAVAVRFGQYGAAAGNLAVTAAAVAFTVFGFGPFVESAGLSESLLRLQILMGVLAVTTLLLGAAVAERDRAVEAREDFLSVASHELRTPLTSLSLQLQGLLRAASGAEAMPRERAIHALEGSLRQTRKLTRLMDDLLDVTRITAGRLRLEPEEVDLGALARQVAAVHAGAISISIAGDGDSTGYWDRHRLEQVLDNLISNALKYGAGKPVEVTVRPMPAAVELRVRDHGIGVAPGDRRRIFNRFERAVSGRRYGGIGLGLWIARRIVEAHQGSIRVESAPGEGATFVVELGRRALSPSSA